MNPLKIDSKNWKNPQQEQLWKETKKGVIIFCIVHFIFELLTIRDSATLILPVFGNYFISTEYIKYKIHKEKPIINPLLTGLSVSGIVFLIRVIIGLIIVYAFK